MGGCSLRIVIVVTFIMLVLSCIHLYQFTNSDKSLARNLKLLISNTNGEGMPFITEQTEDSSFHTKDKLIVMSNARSAVLKVHSVPTPVQDTFKFVPTHRAVHKSSPPTSTKNTVKFRDRLVDFDHHGNDTLVFIHIQKTGGSTFVEHLHTLKEDGIDLCEHAKDLTWWPHGKPSVKHMYRCPRNWTHRDQDSWLLTETIFHIPWLCGVHSSYTTFNYCLPRLTTKFVNPHRNFQYATLLRHPVVRYISEYLHVLRGATWLSDHVCGGRSVTKEEMPPCYPGYYEDKEWPNATLEEFLSCESNWGNNRQVMMLANLEEVGCYNKSRYAKKEREARMLASAKRNLEKFAFFGLTEFLEESGILFEKMLGLQFGKPLRQLPFSGLCSSPALKSVTKDMYEKIAQINKLDVALYNYAVQLFTKRLKEIGVSIDPNRVDIIKTVLLDQSTTNVTLCS